MKRAKLLAVIRSPSLRQDITESLLLTINNSSNYNHGRQKGTTPLGSPRCRHGRSVKVDCFDSRGGEYINYICRVCCLVLLLLLWVVCGCLSPQLFSLSCASPILCARLSNQSLLYYRLVNIQIIHHSFVHSL